MLQFNQGLTRYACLEKNMKSFCMAIILMLAQTVAWAETSIDESESTAREMDNQRLQVLIERVADDVEGRPGFWRFDLEGFEEVDNDRLYRIMQANFDSALDARYSIAQGVLWSAFIHPLSALSDHQFIDGLAQTVNLAATYGTTYSSGALVFSQGDSRGEQNKHYQQIIERENSI
jgi:hypothetical protein